MLSDILFRLRAMFRRSRVEEELDDEMQFHLQHEMEKRTASGLPPSEALRQARLALGGLEQTKEECRRARGLTELESTIQDLSYAMRAMRHSPAFTLAAVLTLGLGTGAISTIFTLANALFFRELAVARPDQIVVVQASRRHGQMPGWVAYPDYVHFRDQTKTLQGLAAHYSTAPLFVTANNRSQEVNGAVVSANFFPVLGVKPVFGRFFRPAEDRVPDHDAVAVLSYQLWRNWFGSSPDAVGATLKINGTNFTVIGVAPQTFRGVTVQPDEIYIPTMMARAGYRWCEDSLAGNCTVFDMIGRLQDGYTVEQARAEMAILMPRSWAAAKEGENTGITAFHAKGALHPDLTRSSELRFIRLLAYVGGVLLLVCCVNLAGLLIARNSARTREFAVRASLGAGRARLLGQLITESLVLAMTSGLMGMLFSLGLTSGLNSMFYSFDVEGHPLYYNFSPEPRVILAILLVSIVAGFLTGIIPALRSIRTDAAEFLKRQSSAVTAGSRSGQYLAVAQAAIAVGLASLAGLLIISSHLMLTGNGFEASRVALMRLRPRLISYPPERAQRYLRTVIERLEAVPGVESASLFAPGGVLVGGDAQVSLPGWPDPQGIECGYIEIGPRYFEALRIPVLRGREFDRHDMLRSPAVAIVSESLARRFWPVGPIIGSALIVNRQPRQVAGIVKDVPLGNRGESPRPYVYIPFWQNPAQLDARLCVRVKGDPAAMLRVLVQEANRVDPDVPIAEAMTLPVRVAASISSLRITATVASYAALLAILLSGIGLYGALAFSVSRRTKEIGIRMAVGAKSAAVLTMIMWEGMAVVFIGVAIGVPLAFAGTRFIRHLLYGSGAADAWVYAAAALGVTCVGLLACSVPARRAASVDPVVALREE
jgi:macrolide transport system ATP-binding/permease protein